MTRRDLRIPLFLLDKYLKSLLQLIYLYIRYNKKILMEWGMIYMAVLKSYTCSKCAGILMFDSDQEFFDCPFCGNRYDIVDFHADEVLAQANSCLEQGSFSSAKEKFGQVLDNDPQNFDALLGTVFCKLKLNSEDKLENSENLETVDLNEAKKVLIKAKRQSVNAKADYFAYFYSLIEHYEKTVKLEKEKQELLSGNTMDELNGKMLSDFKRYRNEDRDSLPWPLIIFGVLALFAVAASLTETGNYFPLIIFFVVLGVICYAVSKNDIVHDENYKPANDYERKLTDKISDNERNYARAYMKMKDLRASIVSDNKEHSVSESKPVADPDIDEGKSINCEKCGAGLILDKNKRVYQCDHCGVAYGVSLFFGLPMEKALNSLNNGNFKDAERRFSNLLMVDPSDFEALLGKVLCAGKWTKVSNIRLSVDVEDDELKFVRDSIKKAGWYASENDQPYFRKMEELVSFFEPYKENKDQIRSLDGDVKLMEAKADVYAKAYEGANYNDEYQKERRELVSKTYPAQVKLKKLEADFADIRRSLIDERAGCRLVK